MNGKHMIHVTACPPAEAAAPFGEVKRGLEVLDEVVKIEPEHWSRGSMERDPGVFQMTVTVETESLGSAFGVVSGCIARLGMSFDDWFVVSTEPLQRKPRARSAFSL
jgi:hypothetical protein